MRAEMKIAREKKAPVEGISPSLASSLHINPLPTFPHLLPPSRSAASRFRRLPAAWPARSTPHLPLTPLLPPIRLDSPLPATSARPKRIPVSRVPVTPPPCNILRPPPSTAIDPSCDAYATAASRAGNSTAASRRREEFQGLEEEEDEAYGEAGPPNSNSSGYACERGRSLAPSASGGGGLEDPALPLSPRCRGLGARVCSRWWLGGWRRPGRWRQSDTPLLPATPFTPLPPGDVLDASSQRRPSPSETLDLLPLQDILRRGAPSSSSEFCEKYTQPRGCRYKPRRKFGRGAEHRR